ncbi:hypothetical protein FMM05_13820 [Flavobacterium zepuense]|uniref:Uncharacterized protein n=1 Tax=Flavobacterium zepuense TaxID=2593302 RepID=A0A552UYJ5_9FLAO|nr:hypothetical protein [Flavobacterium zepuense]TRW23272.1 hypothetical protein FMM05_13820 [Flavobacterium zepuense]
MKKFAFYLFLILAVIFLFSTIDILINDIKRLTEFGWGYLASRVILLVLFTTLTFLMFKRAYPKKA